MDEQVRDGDPFACVKQAADDAAQEDRIKWYAEFRRAQAAKQREARS